MTANLQDFLLIVVLALLFFNLLLSLANTRHMNNLSYLIREEQKELPIGGKAPFFKAHLLNGSPITLRDFDGLNILLLFVSPRCNFCKEPIKTVENLKETLKENFDLNVFIVSDQDKYETEEIIKAYNITLPVIVAPKTENTFMKTYNPLLATPFYCIIDNVGLLQARGTASDQGNWVTYEEIWLEEHNKKKSI